MDEQVYTAGWHKKNGRVVGTPPALPNMTEQERQRHETESAAYMRTLSNAQLDGVISRETERLSKCSEGDVAITARIMRTAAHTEKRVRGLD